MKALIMSFVMVFFITLDAQASTIILKDGGKVTGDIVEQDTTHVVIIEGGSSLTYYYEDIVSIDGESAKSIIEKGKLVEQLMQANPESDVLTAIVKTSVPADKQEMVSAALNNKKVSLEIMGLKEEGYMKYFSQEDLKAMVDYHASPAGVKRMQRMREYYLDVMPKIVKKVVAQIQDSNSFQ